jgi:hypothetical protein
MLTLKVGRASFVESEAAGEPTVQAPAGVRGLRWLFCRIISVRRRKRVSSAAVSPQASLSAGQIDGRQRAIVGFRTRHQHAVIWIDHAESFQFIQAGEVVVGFDRSQVWGVPEIGGDEPPAAADDLVFYDQQRLATVDPVEVLYERAAGVLFDEDAGVAGFCGGGEFGGVVNSDGVLHVAVVGGGEQPAVTVADELGATALDCHVIIDGVQDCVVEVFLDQHPGPI